ncbi:class I SAM-dependent methyltransferase [Staphylococcus debuckii]|uniref:Methyltransferase n=1 Tax=Staphylococcus debuckii TaxID=2044912 RepID=A0ABU9F0R5_9STAP
MEDSVFQHIAHRYDNDPQIHLTGKIAGEMEARMSTPHCVLDYGCGTGLVGLRFADEADHIVFADAENEMLKIVQRKIKDLDLKHAETLHLNVVEDKLPDIQVDTIIMSLVMLHVSDTQTLLKQLFKLLEPGGQILIADFNHNENVSHPLIHSGFTQEEVKAQLEKAGFTDPTIHTFYQGEKIFMNQDASLFLAKANKS